jgi:hypothetical protein
MSLIPDGKALTMLEYSKHSASTDLGSEMISKGSNGVSFVSAINSSISCDA